jgi:hypothetical protein
MQLENALAGRDAAHILNNPKLLLSGDYGQIGADDFRYFEGVINSVMLDMFVSDISDHHVHYIYCGGGGRSSSRSSSSSRSFGSSARATAIGAFAGTIAGGLAQGALSELGARTVSFWGR